MSTIIYAKTRDQHMTFDQRTIDSTGAFFVNQLEVLDPTIYEPLVDFTYSRDIEFRTDVTAADDFSSFALSGFAAGGINPTGKNWIGNNSTSIASAELDLEKVRTDLSNWGMEVSFTVAELEKAMKLGKSIDTQKFEMLQLKYNMDLDEQTYVGDAGKGQAGLLNNSAVSSANAPNGNWTPTTDPDNMIADVNEVLNRAWQNSGYKLAPTNLLLPPTAFSALVTTKVSEAGNMSVFEYLKQFSLSAAKNGKPLVINPVKWGNSGQANASHTTMCAYSNDKRRVRLPMVPLMRTPPQYRGFWQAVTYWGKIGAVEFVYPETVAYSLGV